ncbi:MAG: biotin/lipoyl-containing protein, partial [Planctomycetaceae bacterium]
MATEFKLPDLGENIASGDVVTVFVSEGDVVKPGQALLEVETDKAVIEVPCPPGGRIAKVLVKKGETVKVGQPLVVIEAAGAAPAAAKPAAAAAAPAPAAPAKPAPVSAPAPAPVKTVAAPPVEEPVAAALKAVEPAGRIDREA